MKSFLYLVRVLFMLFMLFVLSAIAFAQSEGIERLISQGELREALALADSELAKDGDNVNYLFYKGTILTKLNELDKAAEVFLRITKEHPELPEPFNNLAVIYAAKGDFVKAQEALQQAINTHPSYATAHENIGDIYAKMASKAYNEALQLDKDNETAREKLSLISELFSARPIEKVITVDSKQEEKTQAKAELARLEQELREATEHTKQQQAKAADLRTELARLEKEAGNTVNRVREEQNRVVEQAKNERQRLEKVRSELAGLEQKRQETLDQIKSEQAKADQVREELRQLEQKRLAALEEVKLAQQQMELANTPPPVVDDGSGSQEVDQSSLRETIKNTVMDWAKLWSEQDVPGYLSYYSSDFTPDNGLSREQWMAQRRVRIAKPAYIKVDILKLNINVQDDNHAQVSFSQKYQSDTYADEVGKILSMRNKDGRWLIDAEKSD